MDFEMSVLIGLGLPALGLILYGLYGVQQVKRIDEREARRQAGLLPAE